MDLVIKSRKGFVRQAFLHKASLVPVLGFGETDVFGILRSERLLAVQRALQKRLGFAMPLFHGRGIFQYHFGFLPHRRPIKVRLDSGLGQGQRMW
jgi:2-acylglycerol O-acyltransferase 2